MTRVLRTRRAPSVVAAGLLAVVVLAVGAAAPVAGAPLTDHDDGHPPVVVPADQGPIEVQPAAGIPLPTPPAKPVVMSTRGAPANPAVRTITQPDGSSFRARSRGDGARHWTETEGGHAVVEAPDGSWWFAGGTDAEGQLVASSRRADDGAAPVAAEVRPTRDAPGPAAPTDPGTPMPAAGPGVAADPPRSPAPLPTNDGPAAASGNVGSTPLLVILASFGDVAPTTPPSYWHDLAFGPTRSVGDYYRQASYGAFDVVPATGGAHPGVVGWIDLGYAHPDLSNISDGSAPQWMVLAMLAAAPSVDFASFDVNHDGALQSTELRVTVVLAGAEGSFGPFPACGPSVWAHASWLSYGWPKLDGLTFDEFGYVAIGERHCADYTDHPATMGVVTHELGHTLGWPDLYDTDFSSNGVGNWSVMGYGSWTSAQGGEVGSSPALPDAFSRRLQGWVVPTQVSSAVGVTVASAETTADVKQILAKPTGIDWAFGGRWGAGEYFLIENRQQSGYDAGLPGCGLLIWHIDEGVTTSNGANADESRPLVRLVEASGTNWLVNVKGFRGGANDPYPGTGHNQSFSPTSNPNSDLNVGEPSGATVSITSTSCAPTMTFDVAAPSAHTPGNDSFATARTIGAQTTMVGSNIGATKEAAESIHASNAGGRSVWWKVVAPAAGSMAISTLTNFRSLLGVYRGTSVRALTPIAESDSISYLPFAVTAGTTYYVVVDGFRDGAAPPGEGSVVLRTTFDPVPITPPPNDSFEASSPLQLVPLTTTANWGSASGATKQAGEPNHAGQAGGASVWWTFTPPVAGTVKLDTHGSGYDTLLAVYTGVSLATLVPVAGGANNDADPANGVLTSETATLPVTAGTQYSVAVDGVSGATGWTMVNARFAPTPVGVAPGPPRAVTAVAASRAATVTWSPPEADGGSAVFAYEVTASPGGATCAPYLADPSPPNQCTFYDLSPGTSYTFTVRATNSGGVGAPSSPSNAVVPFDGSALHSVSPRRLLDSRTSTGGWPGRLEAGKARRLTFSDDIPYSAQAAILNVTVTDSTAGSFLSVFPSGVPIPTSSSLNFGAGQTIANLVTVPIDQMSRSVTFANAIGAVHVVADLVGYYDAGDDPGELFTGITPTRILDSRGANGSWNGQVAQGAPRTLQVRGRGGVPATATAVMANITVTQSTEPSFLTAWPAGVAQPTASTLNFAAGQTIPNLAVVQLGSGGEIALATAAGATDVIVDVVGYFDPTHGARYHPVAPTRVLDDRVGTGLTGPWSAGESRSLPIAGVAGVPPTATGIVMNVTATNATVGSFLTVHPDLVPTPTASNVNFGPGETIANLVATSLGPNGAIRIANALGSVDVVADVNGYFAPT